MNDVLQALANLGIEGKSAALCTIIRTKGSTPRKAGSKMLVYDDGSFVGTIGGGSSEIMREIIAKMVIDDVSYGGSTV